MLLFLFDSCVALVVSVSLPLFWPAAGFPSIRGAETSASEVRSRNWTVCLEQVLDRLNQAKSEMRTPENVGINN
jgi:hypothetical protein